MSTFKPTVTRGVRIFNSHFDTLIAHYKNHPPHTPSQDNSPSTITFITTEESLQANHYFHTPPTPTPISTAFLNHNRYLTYYLYKKLSPSQQSYYYSICTQFLLDSKIHVAVKTHKIPLQFGRYTVEDQIILKYSVYQFLTLKNILFTDFQMAFTLPTFSDYLAEVAQYVCTFFPYRNFQSVLRAIHYHFHPLYNQKLSADDKMLIMSLESVYGKKYTWIAYEINKSMYVVHDFIYKHLRYNKYGNKSNIDNDTIINEYLNNYKFIQISQKHNINICTIRKIIKNSFTKNILHKWSTFYDLILCLLILEHNYFCSVKEATSSLEFMRKGVDHLLVLGAIEDERVHKEGQANQKGSKEGKENKEGVHQKESKEGVNKSNKEENQGTEGVIKQGQGVQANKAVHNQNKQHNQNKKIQTIKSHINSFTPHIKNKLSYPPHNTKIHSNHIPWYLIRILFNQNIQQKDKTVFDNNLLKSKFDILVKQYRLCFYYDLVDVCREMVYDVVVGWVEEMNSVKSRKE